MTGATVGALIAVVASSLFSVGLVLQAQEARTTPGDEAFHVSLLTELVRHPRWLLGSAVIVAGFGFHVAALSIAPLTVVQPALAAGLVVLMIVGLRNPDERAGRREIAGIAGIILGLMAIAFTAPDRSAGEGSVLSIGLALGALTIAVLVPHGLAIFRSRHDQGGSLLATFGAGAAYAMTGLTTKLFSDQVAAGEWGSSALWLVLTAGVAGLGLLDQTSALQRRSVVEVGPIVYVMPVVIPVLLAPALVGEGWGGAPHGTAPLLGSLVIVCLGAAALAGSSSVASGSAPAPVPEPAPSTTSG